MSVSDGEDRPSSTVTELLEEARISDRRVVDELVDRIYAELRTQARRQRHQWKGEPSLQTTALVNEAYERLVDEEARSWESRSHFLAVSARAMRHILIDRARKRKARKRGGDRSPLSLEELREKLGREIAMTEEDIEAFVVLDEALDRLEHEHERAARTVECRFFTQMSIEETAEALEVSTATVSRDWKLAKTWLYREMKRIRGSDQGER